MSYNITGIKERKNTLEITRGNMRSFIDSCDAIGEVPDFSQDINGVWKLEWGDNNIKGREVDGVMYLEEMNITGESSGYLMRDTIPAFLKLARGEYKAMMIWEGGDSLYNFSCTDGNIKEEELL